MTVVHAKCASRADAVEADRLPMTDKFAWVSTDMEIPVDCRSALAWRPEEWE